MSRTCSASALLRKSALAEQVRDIPERTCGARARHTRAHLRSKCETFSGSQPKETIGLRVLVALHARLDSSGGSDGLSIRRNGTVDPAGIGARRFGIELEHDEHVGLLCRLEELVALARIGPEVIVIKPEGGLVRLRPTLDD